MKRLVIIMIATALLTGCSSIDTVQIDANGKTSLNGKIIPVSSLSESFRRNKVLVISDLSSPETALSAVFDEIFQAGIKTNNISFESQPDVFTILAQEINAKFYSQAFPWELANFALAHDHTLPKDMKAFVKWYNKKNSDSNWSAKSLSKDCEVQWGLNVKYLTEGTVRTDIPVIIKFKAEYLRSEQSYANREFIGKLRSPPHLLDELQKSIQQTH